MSASRKLIVTDPAKEDLLRIGVYTKEMFGERAAQAYSKLLRQAFADIRDDPDRPGSKERPEIAGNLKSYHISLSKMRSTPRVKAPRHFVLYFESRDGAVVISRVLHEVQDIRRHIIEDHAKQSRRRSRSAPKRSK